MKRILSLLFALLVGVSSLATAESLKIAAVMPSATNDMAFSQSMFDSLLAVVESLGAENVELSIADGTFIVDDAAEAIYDWAADGYDLIVAHGSQYGAILQEIAPDFPDTSFAWGTAGDTFGLDNVYAYEANSHEGGYVNGVIAATLSETGIVGVVGPIEVGDAKLYVDGFIEGAQATNPDITVNVNYIGSFSDVALASEAAQTHIAAGADVLTGSAQMVVGAIGVAAANGAAWLGTQANQTDLSPEVVVASQVYDWTVALDDIVSNIQEGILGGTAYTIDLANGGLGIEYNDDFASAEAAQAAGEGAIQGIIDGDINPLDLE